MAQQTFLRNTKYYLRLVPSRNLHCYLLLGLGISHQVARSVQLACSVHSLTVPPCLDDRTDWRDLLTELAFQRSWFCSRIRTESRMLFAIFERNNSKFGLAMFQTLFRINFPNSYGAFLSVAQGHLNLCWQKHPERPRPSTINRMTITQFFEIIFAILNENLAEINRLCSEVIKT